uniref:Uncharacterized protein n=1 Tax=Myotis myotis TaxID=51298 RepID=A0A7J7TJ90_MYOMY|nr:hypothetical protein mMyoMyo1_009059 [Myotis myotis]
MREEKIRAGAPEVAAGAHNAELQADRPTHGPRLLQDRAAPAENTRELRANRIQFCHQRPPEQEQQWQHNFIVEAALKPQQAPKDAMETVITAVAEIRATLDQATAALQDASRQLLRSELHIHSDPNFKVANQTGPTRDHRREPGKPGAHSGTRCGEMLQLRQRLVSCCASASLLKTQLLDREKMELQLEEVRRESIEKNHSKKTPMVQEALRKDHKEHS